MGYDFTSIHVFAQIEPIQIRERIINRLVDFVSGSAVTQSAASRSIVVGPPTRWIFVGDSSSGTTEDGDSKALDNSLTGCQWLPFLDDSYV